MSRRFNSKFYNVGYYDTIHLNKAADNVMVKCTVYGTITQKLLKELKEKYEFVPENDIIAGMNWFKIQGVMSKKQLFHAKEELKNSGISIAYDKYVYTYCQIPEGYLYSGWKTGRRTKIKPEDLPDSYVRITNYKKNGYIETKGVTDIFYCPSVFHNHTFKDDFLYLSYSKEFTKEELDDHMGLYSLCDEYVFGNDILTVVCGIEKNNPDNQLIQDKIRIIKQQLVIQYNAYVNEMNTDWGRNMKYIQDFNELVS